MAITQVSRPASPNFSNRPLVFVLSSNNLLDGTTERPNFSIVATVTVGSEVFTYRKQSNPAQRFVIDLTQVVDNNLDWELGPLGATTEANYVNQYKSFSVVFSEEYDVNGNGSLQIVNPTTAVTLRILKGEYAPNQGNLSTAPTFGPILSDQFPGGNRIHRDERALVTYYHEDTTTVRAAVVSPVDGQDTVTVTLEGQAITFNVYEDRSSEGDSRFWWINREGGWNFFTFDQVQEVSTNIDRNYASQSEITHGFTTSSNRDPQNTRVFKASSVNYRSSYEQNIVKRSSWLNIGQADFVSGIFESPNVYLESSGTYIPVTVTNGSYDAARTSRDGRLTSYELNYRLTNGPRSI